LPAIAFEEIPPPPSKDKFNTSTSFHESSLVCSQSKLTEEEVQQQWLLQDNAIFPNREHPPTFRETALPLPKNDTTRHIILL
jgi:hypothetical protein